MNAFILVVVAQLSGSAWGPMVDNTSFKTMAACQAHAEFISDQMVELSKTNSTVEFRKEKSTDGGLFVRSDNRISTILRCRLV